MHGIECARRWRLSSLAAPTRCHCQCYVLVEKIMSQSAASEGCAFPARADGLLALFSPGQVARGSVDQ